MRPLPSRRFGKFMIPFEWLYDYPKWVKGIMATCLILRAEIKAEYDSIEYMAINEWFDEVPLGSKAPEYRIRLCPKTGWMFDEI